MNLAMPESSLPVKEMFERFFATECTPARVRAAEPVGFDADLWRQLVELEAPFLRLSAEAGGSGLGLFDACLMMEEAGRRLAPVPLAESVVALRLLGELGGETARGWIEKVRGGSVLTVALKSAENGERQLVPGGAAADGVLTFDGREIAIEVPGAPMDAPITLGGAAMGVFEPGKGKRCVVSTKREAAQIWSQAIEEWKLLTASALIGMSLEAIAMASAYACERTAFGQAIGANQGLAHPLANDVMDADGAQMFLWRTLRALADREPDAAAMVSQLYWWASRTASNCVAHSLHAFGGYGLTNEYDIQLYNRRAKAWALALGDPREELIRAGRRQMLGEAAAVPDPGVVEVDFASPAGGEELAARNRAVFVAVLDPAKHKLHDNSFGSHSWEVHRALGKEGLLFPNWPVEYGGLGAGEDSVRSTRAVWQEVGYLGPTRSTTALVGAAILAFGTPELKREVLPRFASGEITASLGYTEPSGGSDVFAAKTRAVRHGDDWIIDGQKMFTSGAEWSSYVFLIARTDPQAPKHKGLTMFLVPLDAPGVEIQPVHTFMDERTNATFYAGVRVPDKNRIGEVNGGVKVLASALTQEQSGHGYHDNLRQMAGAVADWARCKTRDGRPLIEDSDTLARLAQVHTLANVSECLTARVLGMRLAGVPDRAFGPEAKVFSTEAFISSSADLLDLAAPDSLVRGVEGLGAVEMGYRHSAATTVYGGTSEVLRSMVAERRLGLPRSRQ